MKSLNKHFPKIGKIAYEGPHSANALAFKHYNPSEVVDGRTLKEHMRFSIAYWHAFRGVGSDPFGPGTIVQATDLQSNQTETFTILGAWDSDPDKGIISYLTPVAMALLNRKVGDEVEFELHGSKRRQRIEKIEAWKTEIAAATETAAVSAA